MKKKIVNLFLIVGLLAAFAVLAVSVNAVSADIAAELELELLDENACGYIMKTTDGTTANDGTANDFYWQINSAGTLIISHKTPEGATPSTQILTNPTIAGTGSHKNLPWSGYQSYIKKIIFNVDDPVIYIECNYLFMSLTNLTTVVLPQGKVHTYAQYLFTGCKNLVTFGPEGTPDNTFDLRNMVGVHSDGKSVANSRIFPGCAVGADITVYMPYAKTLSAATLPCIGYNYNWKNGTKIYDNFEGAASVVFKVLEGSIGDTVAQAFANKYNSEANPWTVVSYAEGECLVKGTSSSGHTESGGWSCDWEYALDLGTGVLDIKYISGTPSYRCSYVPNDVVTNLGNEFGYLITRLNFIDFEQIFECWKGPILPSTMTKLTTVDIGSINNVRNGSASRIWFNCPSLTTFGSSERNTLNEGVIDLTGISFSAASYKLFSGCSGAKKLIIPESNMTVTSSTFAGFENLEEITLGKTTVSDGSFDGLSSLKNIYLVDKNFEDDAENKLLPVDKDGLKIICYTESVAESLTDYGATKVIYFGDIIIPDGFSVRTQKTASSTNGLRTLYKFDKSRREALEAAGLKFKEFGGIIVSASKLGNNTLSLSWNGTEYVPNIESAVKAPIFVGSADGDIMVGKVLSDNDEYTEFAITIVNFKNNFKTDVYACGYAIFVDENGDEYIEYSNYGDLEGNEDWKYVNIFDLVMNLYTHTNIMEDSLADEAPIWGILGTESLELEDSLREITLEDGNTVMMVVEDSAGGYNLFVRCLDGTKPSLTYAEAKATELGYNTLAHSIGIMIKEDADFAIKTAWEAYVDNKLSAAKLTSSEKSKSFIFVTDNHWDVNTKNNKKVTFATEVMKYVSTQLGDAPVIFGGDPFGGYYENHVDAEDPYVNIKTALKVIDDYVIDQLKANFGTNFFYALGNHDTNVIGYRKAKTSIASGGLGYDQATAMEYYLISDKDMYDHSVGVFAEKGIVFDNDGIEAIKTVLINNGYTDNETLSEAEYMMKMHYHYDDADAKIRYIVVDTGGCGRTQMGLYKFGWNGMFASQYKWLANTLKGTPEGYDIVVVGHQIVESKTTVANRNDTKFQAGMAEIYDVISAFKTGADVNVRYPATSWHKEEYGQIFMDMVEYGTADINFENPFDGTVFTIGGHVHSDNGWYSNNNGILTYVQFGDEGVDITDGAVLAITTGTARNHDTHPNVDGYEMGSSFPENMRFDVVTIRDDGSVLLTRIGAGYDRAYAYGK